MIMKKIAKKFFLLSFIASFSFLALGCLHRSSPSKPQDKPKAQQTQQPAYLQPSKDSMAPTTQTAPAKKTEIKNDADIDAALGAMGEDTQDDQQIETTDDSDIDNF